MPNAVCRYGQNSVKLSVRDNHQSHSNLVVRFSEDVSKKYSNLRGGPQDTFLGENRHGYNLKFHGMLTNVRANERTTTQMMGRNGAKTEPHDLGKLRNERSGV